MIAGFADATARARRARRPRYHPRQAPNPRAGWVSCSESLCALSRTMTVRRQRGLRPGDAQGSRRRRVDRVHERGAGPGEAGPGTAELAIRANCPAASGSAVRWRARWSSRPPVLLLDEPLVQPGRRSCARTCSSNCAHPAQDRHHHADGDARSGRSPVHQRSRGGHAGRPRHCRSTRPTGCTSTPADATSSRASWARPTSRRARVTRAGARAEVQAGELLTLRCDAARPAAGDGRAACRLRPEKLLPVAPAQGRLDGTRHHALLPGQPVDVRAGHAGSAR